MRGRLPGELGDLSGLETLQILFCQCSGDLPPELARLSGLREISLDFNGLSGPLPPWLGDLPELRILSLTMNNFSGTIPVQLGRLSNLEVLWLQDNQLTGEIPESLGNPSRLQFLSFDENRLSGTVPARLGDLPWLERFGIGDNPRLTGCVPAGLRSVQDLWLGHNPLPFCDVALGPTPTPLVPGAEPLVPSEFQWVQDGLEGQEQQALRIIEFLAREHHRLAARMLAFPWLHDGLTGDEHAVLVILRGMVRDNLPLAEAVVTQPWVAGREAEVTRVILPEIRHRGDLETAGLLGDTPGLRPFLYGILFEISKTSGDIFADLTGLPWFQDGHHTDYEEEAVMAIWAFFRQSQPNFTRELIGLPWYPDGVTRDEAAAMRYWVDIAAEDRDLAARVIALRWFHDGITGTDHLPDSVEGGERQGVAAIRNLAAKDISVAWRVMDYDWVNDGDMIQYESGVLSGLSELDAPMIHVAANLPFISGLAYSELEFPGLHGSAAFALLRTARDYPGRFNQIINHGWFTDGVSDDDAAVIVVQEFTDDRSSRSPNRLFQDLMQDSQVTSWTARATMAGDVEVFTVHSRGVRRTGKLSRWSTRRSPSSRPSWKPSGPRCPSSSWTPRTFGGRSTSTITSS